MVTMASPTPPRPPAAAAPPEKTPTAQQKPASSYSLFPPIPAPLQRLFDRVPLVTYPPNPLPATAALLHHRDAPPSPSPDRNLPILFVFLDPADAPAGRPSFNPTCLKWQAFLRFAGVPVRLAASNNHASPTGALPFLLPPPEVVVETAPATRTPPPVVVVPAHGLVAYAESHGRSPPPPTTPSSSSDTSSSKPYSALLDTALRRAWLHAVYLQDNNNNHTPGSTIAARLYAAAASASPLVRTALARELRAAAAAEVYGSDKASSSLSSSSFSPRSTHQEAAIYRDAEAALAALAALLEKKNGNDDDDDDDAAAFFFGHAEPTLFDAHVFSYTHLLLEDDDNDDDGDDDDDGSTSTSTSTAKRFRWTDRRLPELVRAQPRLVQHRNRILARYWPAAAATRTAAAAQTPVDDNASNPGAAGNPADSVSWVKV